MREPEYYLGNPVLSLQTMLRRISDSDARILPLIPDGYYGPNTIASVRSFQEAYSLPVTGSVDQQTWDSIVSAYTRVLPEQTAPVTQPLWFPGQSVQPGESNIHLYLVQAMLLALSQYYPDLTPPDQVNGTLDASTEQGLRWIQRAAGLPETGVLNTLTWHALNDLYRTTTGTGEQ